MKSIIVYYSYSGSIESLVPKFKEYTKSNIFKLELKEPYSLDMKEFVERVREELNNSLLPKYKEKNFDLAEYDTVYLAVPNWGNTVPPVVKTFLKENSLKDKTIYPIINHGGNGKVDIVDQIRVLTKSSKVQEALEIYTNEITDEALETYFK